MSVFSSHRALSEQRSGGTGGADTTAMIAEQGALEEQGTVGEQNRE